MLGSIATDMHSDFVCVCYLGNCFCILYHLDHAHVVSSRYAAVWNEMKVKTAVLPKLVTMATTEEDTTHSKKINVWQTTFL